MAQLPDTISPRGSRPLADEAKNTSDDQVNSDPGWACPACTFINPPGRVRCEMCEHSHPDITSYYDGVELDYSDTDDEEGLYELPELLMLTMDEQGYDAKKVMQRFIECDINSTKLLSRRFVAFLAGYHDIYKFGLLCPGAIVAPLHVSCLRDFAFAQQYLTLIKQLVAVLEPKDRKRLKEINLDDYNDEVQGQLLHLLNFLPLLHRRLQISRQLVAPMVMTYLKANDDTKQKLRAKFEYTRRALLKCNTYCQWEEIMDDADKLMAERTRFTRAICEARRRLYGVPERRAGLKLDSKKIPMDTTTFTLQLLELVLDVQPRRRRRRGVMTSTATMETVLDHVLLDWMDCQCRSRRLSLSTVCLSRRAVLAIFCMTEVVVGFGKHRDSQVVQRDGGILLEALLEQEQRLKETDLEAENLLDYKLFTYQCGRHYGLGATIPIHDLAGHLKRLKEAMTEQWDSVTESFDDSKEDGNFLEFPDDRVPDVECARELLALVSRGRFPPTLDTKIYEIIVGTLSITHGLSPEMFLKNDLTMQQLRFNYNIEWNGTLPPKSLKAIFRESAHQQQPLPNHRPFTIKYLAPMSTYQFEEKEEKQDPVQAPAELTRVDSSTGYSISPSPSPEPRGLVLLDKVSVNWEVDEAHPVPPQSLASNPEDWNINQYYYTNMDGTTGWMKCAVCGNGLFNMYLSAQNAYFSTKDSRTTTTKLDSPVDIVTLRCKHMCCLRCFRQIRVGIEQNPSTYALEKMLKCPLCRAQYSQKDIATTTMMQARDVVILFSDIDHSAAGNEPWEGHRPAPAERSAVELRVDTSYQEIADRLLTRAGRKSTSSVLNVDEEIALRMQREEDRKARCAEERRLDEEHRSQDAIRRIQRAERGDNGPAEPNANRPIPRPRNERGTVSRTYARRSNAPSTASTPTTASTLSTTSMPHQRTSAAAHDALRASLAPTVAASGTIPIRGPQHATPRTGVQMVRGVLGISPPPRDVREVEREEREQRNRLNQIDRALDEPRNAGRRSNQPRARVPNQSRNRPPLSNQSNARQPGQVQNGAAVDMVLGLLASTGVVVRNDSGSASGQVDASTVAELTQLAASEISLHEEYRRQFRSHTQDLQEQMRRLQRHRHTIGFPRNSRRTDSFERGICDGTMLRKIMLGHQVNVPNELSGRVDYPDGSDGRKPDCPICSRFRPTDRLSMELKYHVSRIEAVLPLHGRGAAEAAFDTIRHDLKPAVMLLLIQRIQQRDCEICDDPPTFYLAQPGFEENDVYVSDVPGVPDFDWRYDAPTYLRMQVRKMEAVIQDHDAIDALSRPITSNSQPLRLNAPNQPSSNPQASRPNAQNRPSSNSQASRPNVPNQTGQFGGYRSYREAADANYDYASFSNLHRVDLMSYQGRHINSWFNHSYATIYPHEMSQDRPLKTWESQEFKRPEDIPQGLTKSLVFMYTGKCLGRQEEFGTRAKIWRLYRWDVTEYDGIKAKYYKAVRYPDDWNRFADPGWHEDHYWKNGVCKKAFLVQSDEWHCPNCGIRRLHGTRLICQIPTSGGGTRGCGLRRAWPRDDPWEGVRVFNEFDPRNGSLYGDERTTEKVRLRHRAPEYSHEPSRPR